MISILPTPKSIEEFSGSFDARNAVLFLPDGVDRRIYKAACTLCSELSCAAGKIVPMSCGAPRREAIVLYVGGNELKESYSIRVSAEHIEINAPGPRGAFYAIQSLRQMVSQFGACLPCCFIEDEPDFAFRGFYQDVTRGRVNKPEKLRHIVDMLAYYKINSLQIYIEDAFLFKEFEGLITASEAMTANEMLEIDDYCYDHFIELIPSLSTFGHLFTLLQSDRYNCICELPHHKLTTHYWMEKQWHHTVDPYNPETIKVIGSMIEQYIPLFRSDKFNICCDETMDLCCGRNKGKDKGEAYFYHLNKLIDLVESHGKKVMMWGDVCMAHPELMKAKVISPVTVLNWCYGDPVPEWLGRFFTDMGYESINCTCTMSHSKFIENIDASCGNITSFSTLGLKYGALGMLNTNWGDFGHICSFNCNLYGMLFGAQKSWNVGAPTGTEYQLTASRQLYGVTEFNMADTLRRLGIAQRTCDWFNYVMWYSKNVIEGDKTDLKYDDSGELTDSDAVNAIGICKAEEERLRSLNRKDDPVIGDLILASRATALMNRLMLYVRDVPGYGDREGLQGDFNAWFEEYSDAWLRDDKPSQLWRLGYFIRNITNVKS